MHNIVYTAMLRGYLWVEIIQLKLKALVHLQKKTWYLWRCWQRGWGLGRDQDPPRTLYCVQMLTPVVSTLMRNSWPLRSWWAAAILIDRFRAGLNRNTLGKWESLTLPDIGLGGKKGLPALCPAGGTGSSGSAERVSGPVTLPDSARLARLQHLATCKENKEKEGTLLTCPYDAGGGPSVQVRFMQKSTNDCSQAEPI